MKKENIFIWLALSVSGFAHSDELRNYGYFAKKVPAAPGENCHFQAKNLAGLFSEITGIAGVGTCENIHPEGNDILIRYQAKDPLSVVSSVPDLDFPGRGHEFSNQADCEASIEMEKSYFESFFKTKPVLSFCRSRENYYGLKRWALVLEGFSEAKTRLGWSSSLFPGRPDRSQVSAIKKAVKDELNHEGLQVRFAFLQEDEKGHLRLNVFHYSRFSEQVKAFALASLPNFSDCEMALSELDSSKNTEPSVKTIATCVNNPYQRSVDLVAIIDVTQWHEISFAAEAFNSFAQCISEKEKLTDFYKTELGRPVIASFCTEWGPNWKLRLIEKNRSFR